MTEPTPQYNINGRTNDEYQLTAAEQQYLSRLHRMQNEAARRQRPVMLTVFFDGRTVSFFDGNPSGIVRDE